MIPTMRIPRGFWHVAPIGTPPPRMRVEYGRFIDPWAPIWTRLHGWWCPAALEIRTLDWESPFVSTVHTLAFEKTLPLHTTLAPFLRPTGRPDWQVYFMLGFESTTHDERAVFYQVAPGPYENQPGTVFRLHTPTHGRHPYEYHTVGKTTEERRVKYTVHPTTPKHPLAAKFLSVDIKRTERTKLYVDAPHATLSRIDLVCTNETGVKLVHGEPFFYPVRPKVPSGYKAVAWIHVRPGQTNIVETDIIQV
jgi:hypothetical protein